MNNLIFVVGLYGSPGCGKDSAANVMQSIGFGMYHLAYPIKLLAHDFFGVPKEELHGRKSDRSRQILQYIGTEACDNDIYPCSENDHLIWMQFFRVYLRSLAGIHGLKNQGPKPSMRVDALNGIRVVVPDARKINQLDFIRDIGGLLIRIDRPGYNDTNNQTLNSHPAENEWKSYKPDHVFINDYESVNEYKLNFKRFIEDVLINSR